jgi:hypothetical protein
MLGDFLFIVGLILVVCLAVWLARGKPNDNAGNQKGSMFP